MICVRACVCVCGIFFFCFFCFFLFGPRLVVVFFSWVVCDNFWYIQGKCCCHCLAESRSVVCFAFNSLARRLDLIIACFPWPSQSGAVASGRRFPPKRHERTRHTNAMLLQATSKRCVCVCVSHPRLFWTPVYRLFIPVCCRGEIQAISKPFDRTANFHTLFPIYLFNFATENNQLDLYIYLVTT